MNPKCGEGTWTLPWLAARVLLGLVIAGLIVGLAYLVEVLG